MKKIINIVLAALLVSSALLSQNFKPITFVNYSPLWSHYSMAEGLPINTQSYIPKSTPIFKDGSIYLLHNIWDDYFYQGHLTEKINNRTGKLELSSYKYFTQVNTREYAQSFTSDSGIISISIFKEAKTPIILGSSLFWGNSILGRRNYEDINGFELDSIVTDTLDLLNKNLLLPLSFGNLTANTFLYKKGLNTKYIAQYASGLASIYTSTLLDQNGHVIDSTTLSLVSNYLPKTITTKDLTNNRILSLVYSVNKASPVDSQDVKLYLFDQNLNLTKETSLLSHLPKIFQDHRLKANNNNLIHVHSWELSTHNFQTIMVSSFDFDGNLIEQVAVNDVLYSSFASAVTPNDNTMIVSFGKEENGYYNIYIYKSDGHGNLQLKKKLLPDSNDDIISVDNMYITPENDLLINFTHVSRKLQNLTIVPKWTNWTLFSGKDFGIVTAIDDVKLKNSNKIFLLPNPVSDVLNATFEQALSGTFHIYNCIGQLMLANKFDNTKFINIIVGQLPNGNYNLQLLTEQKVFNVQFIKIK